MDTFNTIISGISSPQKELTPYYLSEHESIYNGDCLEILSRIPDDSIDMIFADPPYLLSNNGFTCQNGRMVTVNKGAWDASKGFENDSNFHTEWIAACRRILKPEGTIWISGTYHSIYQCGYLLQKQGFHMLNDIVWFKPNASPNLSCRFFTASHETLLWARKDKNAKHTFQYEQMKQGHFPEDKLKNENMQMRSVWSIPVTPKREKESGKHPTQKPVSLLTRIVAASTNPGDIVLDPFNGGGTTGVACKNAGERYYIGIEIDTAFCALTEQRLKDL
ncbi:MAG: site-specific DNA-methyltransferase [Spirochaetaceae bacterium]|jgi:site-specific DNA-methyltransferase (adenine-specific)|nr:site-specific DNA-methyltransferase [Spirochaetaceae bacterium]